MEPEIWGANSRICNGVTQPSMPQIHSAGKHSLFRSNMKTFKTLLILTLLLGDFGIPPNPAKELPTAYTTLMLAMKSNVLLHGSWNGFMLIVWPPPTLLPSVVRQLILMTAVRFWVSICMYILLYIYMRALPSCFIKERNKVSTASAYCREHWHAWHGWFQKWLADCGRGQGKSRQDRK